MSTPMFPRKKFELPKDKIKAKVRSKLSCLKQLHLHGILAVQVIIWSILISFILWLFIRVPEPQVTLRSFRIDGFNNTEEDTTLIHYDITLHNPDLYKTISYDVLVMRITHSDDFTVFGVTVNFLNEGEELHQGRMNTFHLPNQAVHYTGEDSKFDLGLRVHPGLDNSYYSTPGLFPSLNVSKTYIQLHFVMQLKVIGFTRQRVRTAQVYFDDHGNAFIAPPGLRFK